MTEVGSKQGYNGVECIKERSIDGEGRIDEDEGGNDIFFRVKEMELHAMGGDDAGVVF